MKHTLADVIGTNGLISDGDWIESKDQDPSGDVRIVQLADVGVGRYIDKSRRFMTAGAASRLKCTFLRPGDLLLARMPDPIGRTCIFPGDSKPSVTAVDVCILRCNPDEVSSSWLCHTLNSRGFSTQLNRHVSGTTRQRIPTSALKKIKLDVPPLPEQRRIAAILDQADALRIKRREGILRLHKLAASAFNEMFGDPDSNTRNWDVQPLGKTIGDIRYGTGSPPTYSPEGIPFIRATNIKQGTVIPKGMAFISEQAAAVIQKCRLSKGDLIIVRSGANTGDCGLIPAKYDGAYAGFDLIVRMGVDEANFYNYLLNSKYGQMKLKPLTRRAGQPHLNSEQISSLRLIAPPKVLVSRFREIMEGINQMRIIQEQEFTSLDSLFASLQHRAFRGEL